MRAEFIITDRGRILKDRNGAAPRQVDTFDLVRSEIAGRIKPKKKLRTKYRSIFDE
jgi:hypothetical protein